MSRINHNRLEVAYIEWDEKGKIHIILKSVIRNMHLNALDRLAFELRNPPALEHFDVNWCERDRKYYFHNSGYGPGPIFLSGSADPKKIRFKFWAAANMTFTGWSEKTQKTRKLTAAQIKNLGYDRVDEFKWTDDITVGNDMYDRPPAEEGECYWCDQCQDMLPEEDKCDHVFVCRDDDCNEQGYEQLTHCPDREVCSHYQKEVTT